MSGRYSYFSSSSFEISSPSIWFSVVVIDLVPAMHARGCSPSCAIGPRSPQISIYFIFRLPRTFASFRFLLRRCAVRTPQFSDERSDRDAMPDFETKPDMRAIHGRFVRLFLEHKAEAGVAGLSDEQVVEQAPVIFETLMAVYVEAGRKGDAGDARSARVVHARLRRGVRRRRASRRRSGAALTASARRQAASGRVGWLGSGPHPKPYGDVGIDLNRPHVIHMGKAARFWTCEVCGQVLPNEPKPVLTHAMSHAQRAWATSVPDRSDRPRTELEPESGSAKTDLH